MAAAIALGMTSRERRGIVHLLDDELAVARLGEAMWPDRFAPIRRLIEQERWARSRLH